MSSLVNNLIKVGTGSVGTPSVTALNARVCNDRCEYCKYQLTAELKSPLSLALVGARDEK